MASAKPLSIIIPWKSGNPIREEHLKRCLDCMTVQQTSNINDPITFELIIVEQVNDLNEQYAATRIKEILPYALSTSKTIDFVGFTYIPLKLDSTAFNKSWCMNVAARQAKFNNLVFIDADSLFGADYFKIIKYFLETTPSPHNQIMVCWNYLIGLPGKDNPISRHIRPDMTRTLGGIWAANKNYYFDNFGGMNENFLGYGGEDNEGYERACHVLGLENVSWMAYPLAHQYHDWEVPHPDVVGLFELGRLKPQEITNRLIKAKLGNPEHPTFIYIGDLR